jgi:general secretion pathway protein E
VVLPREVAPRLFRATGCPDCKGTGYVGRLGVHELLSVTPAYHPAIVNGVDVSRLAAIAKEHGFRTMFEDGIRKAIEGMTTLEEIMRVTQQ